MTEKVDTYQVVTDRIIAGLEQGVVPWNKPWRVLAGFSPTSLSSGQPYRGINIFMLGIESMLKGYESPYWLTFRQARERGGSVRRGEKSTPIVFWKFIERGEEGTPEYQKFPLLRYFSVFNVDQTDGVSGVPVIETPDEFDPIERAEQAALGMPQRPEVKHSGEPRAYYSPLLDFVHLPLRASFEEAEAYYATLFHELVHATGHESRLNRDGIEAVTPFGTETYSKEELVAEMGAAFICGEAGIEPRIEQSSAYIGSWLKVLGNDKKFVVQAASQAGKAADFILDRKPPSFSKEELVADIFDGKGQG